MSDDQQPRVAPGNRRRIGPLNAAIVWVIGRATGGRPPNVFTTLARNRGLFRRWLFFAAGLMPGGRLPRRDTELVILRDSHNIGVSLVCPGGVKTPLVETVEIVGVDSQSPLVAVVERA
jgi:hypothetical protein